MSARAQSLVEFALIAPVVILLAMAAWDGGSVLREQVVLQQAARDGARVGATAFGGATTAVVTDAVLASAADLVGTTATVTADSQSMTVRVTYTHALITPMLRQLWGGSVALSASATFYVPSQTPAPATIVPSTPIPSATPTPTFSPTPTLTATPIATPTPTVTPTATATVTPAPRTCSVPVSIPPLANNTSYDVTVQLTIPSTITATWTIPGSVGGQIEVNIYSGNTPPANLIVSNSANSNQSSSVTASTPSESPGTYTIEFFKGGAALDTTSSGTIVYQGLSCP